MADPSAGQVPALPDNPALPEDIAGMSVDRCWAHIRVEAVVAAAQEPALASFLHATILNHESFKLALSYRLAQKLSDTEMDPMQWREICMEAYAGRSPLVEAGLHDIRAVYTRDPACSELMQPFLYFKGYFALQAQRVAHWLWHNGRAALALYLQSRMSEKFHVDIHPATQIGKGIFMDHATGIVIGETAVVEDGVSILQNVTLGGTGKETGDRHPKIREGALISVGAKVLGNIEIGQGAKVAAGSVVLDSVPARCTVAGIPAKKVGVCRGQKPSESMNQLLSPDATYSI